MALVHLGAPCDSIDKFEKLNKVEEGTYGVVYRARNKHTNEIVAIKKLKLDSKASFPLTALREIKFLLELKHPNVIDLKEIVVGDTRGSVFMVMEFVEHDLRIIQDSAGPNPPFSMAAIKSLMQQLLRGLEYLHSCGVMHRDIKSSNLLYDQGGHLKIADFGLAREMRQDGHYTQRVVTLWYRPPEILMGSTSYNPAVDMWAAGCIMGELLAREPVLTGRSEIDQLEQTFRLLGTPTEKEWPGMRDLPFWNTLGPGKNVYPRDEGLRRFLGMDTAVPKVSPAGYDLMHRLLTYDPTQRPSAHDALEHVWFTVDPLPLTPEKMPSFPTENKPVQEQLKAIRRRHSEAPFAKQHAYQHLLQQQDNDAPPRRPAIGYSVSSVRSRSEPNFFLRKRSESASGVAAAAAANLALELNGGAPPSSSMSRGPVRYPRTSATCRSSPGPSIHPASYGTATAPAMSPAAGAAARPGASPRVSQSLPSSIAFARSLSTPLGAKAFDARPAEQRGDPKASIVNGGGSLDSSAASTTMPIPPWVPPKEAPAKATPPLRGNLASLDTSAKTIAEAKSKQRRRRMKGDGDVASPHVQFKLGGQVVRGGSGPAAGLGDSTDGGPLAAAISSRRKLFDGNAESPRPEYPETASSLAAEVASAGSLDSERHAASLHAIVRAPSQDALAVARAVRVLVYLGAAGPLSPVQVCTLLSLVADEHVGLLAGVEAFSRDGDLDELLDTLLMLAGGPADGASPAVAPSPDSVRSPAFSSSSSSSADTVRPDDADPTGPYPPMRLTTPVADLPSRPSFSSFPSGPAPPANVPSLATPSPGRSRSLSRRGSIGSTGSGVRSVLRSESDGEERDPAELDTPRRPRGRRIRFDDERPQPHPPPATERRRDPATEGKVFEATGFLSRLGQALRLPQLTIATACVFLHTFFDHNSAEKFLPMRMATAGVLLALKVTEMHRSMRDLLLAEHRVLTSEDGDASSEAFAAAKTDTVAYEIELLRTLGFRIAVELPYHSLLEHIKAIGGSRQLAQIAWNFINDSFRTPLCIRVDSVEIIAVAAVCLANTYLQLPLHPLTGSWRERCGASVEIAEAAMLELYRSHPNPGARTTVRALQQQRAPEPPGVMPVLGAATPRQSRHSPGEDDLGE